MTKKKVVVALSGGKDSTASIVLLKEQNYDVHALTMQLGLNGEEERLEKIKKLTRELSIPHRVVDMREPFKERVIDYFLQAYADSLTPNPCAVCNIEIKFNLLMQDALRQDQADFYATGHYARIKKVNGLSYLAEPEDKTKSQIYFLSMIGREALQQVLFPIYGLTIDDVRKTVNGLPLANKAESQDVCFLQNDKLIDFLQNHLPGNYFKPGDILDTDGNKIGRHRGAVYFTIGQRRGTGFSSDRKLYVVRKNVRKNTITLGDEEFLYSSTFTVKHPVYWKPIKKGDFYNAKIRYMTPFSEVEIIDVGEKYIKARFSKPEKSVTPGQIGAFYDNDIIAAAGYISS
jgi:tRNA-uridine 2-sulfurtransferase